MLTIEQSLAELVRLGRITTETALTNCNHPEDLRRHMGH
jgi:twitching motility protein PilT